MRFKQQKSELDSDRSEAQVLAHTVETLRHRAAEARAALTEKERELGVEGFTAAQSELEHISSQQSQANQMKSAALVELSRLVEQMNAKLQQHRESLGPKVVELRRCRQQFEAIEEQYQSKLRVLDGLRAGLEASVCLINTSPLTFFFPPFWF